MKVESEAERIQLFDGILLDERKALDLPCDERALADPCGTALAISGGGIRSASFALGVIQTFLNEAPADAQRKDERCFDRFDYMSTVSGGGYIGGALSWLKFHYGRGEEWRRHLGDRDLGTRSAEFQADKTEGVGDSKFTWLDYFRQHGYYLQPSSMSAMSLAGVALRGMLITLSVYTAILALILWALQVGGVLVPGGSLANWAGHPARIESWLLFLGFIVSGAFLLFGVASWLGSIPTHAVFWLGPLPPIAMVLGGVSILRLQEGWPLNPDGLEWRWPLGAGLLLAAGACLVLLWWARSDLEQARGGTQVVHKWQYRVRILYQQVLGPLLTGLTLLLAIWSVPYVYALIGEKLGGTAGISSSLLGVAGAIYQFLIGRDKKVTSSAMSTLRILITATLLVYGILLVAYWIVHEGSSQDVVLGTFGLPLLALIGAAGLFGGFVVNANYIGIGRMYRDRLMELFMPNKEAIVLNQWHRAGNADQFDLVSLVDEKGAPQRPLHLVNCNVVMVGARQDRFRGRGGDSFVLSAKYSGSSATGWTRTSQLGDGHFTLATAVACSGAAASPHTGVAGRGITRNALVSLLLSLTNVRLGYWIRSPRASGGKPKTWHKWFPPNLLAPGIRQGLFGSGTTEEAFFIELTDGGHFDNTGLYELIRRRVRVVVLSQGSCDLTYSKEDLANAIERARVDFGVHIRFGNNSYPLGDITAELGKAVKRGWAVGTIRYPGSDEPGILLYLQASPVAGMNADTESYWRRNVDFPNQTTADQFFDEEQLEAYRELGMAIAQDCIATLKRDRDVQNAPAQALRAAFGW
ncbi:MAG TPA: patatin-like phospholipase family protein [Steroidobacteraceae bacterium]